MKSSRGRIRQLLIYMDCVTKKENKQPVNNQPELHKLHSESTGGISSVESLHFTEARRAAIEGEQLGK